MDKEYTRDNYIFSFSTSAIAYVMYANFRDKKEKVYVKIGRTPDGRYIYILDRSKDNAYYYYEYKNCRVQGDIKYYNHAIKVVKEINKAAKYSRIEVPVIDLEEMDSE